MNFFKILNILAIIAISNVNASELPVFNQQNVSIQNIVEFGNIEPIANTSNDNSFADGLEDIIDTLDTSHNSELNRSFIATTESDEAIDAHVAQIMAQGNIHLDLRRGHTYNRNNSVVIITIFAVNKCLY